MKLEHFGMAEPGDCRLVFTASAEELAAALAKEQAAPDAPQDEEELLTAAVNRTILEEMCIRDSSSAKQFKNTSLPTVSPPLPTVSRHRLRQL